MDIHPHIAPYITQGILFDQSDPPSLDNRNTNSRERGHARPWRVVAGLGRFLQTVTGCGSQRYGGKDKWQVLADRDRLWLTKVSRKRAHKGVEEKISGILGQDRDTQVT
jgi:hypothetical protein